MTMTLSGNGTIAGLVAGGLPDATITQPDLASGVAGNGPAFSAFKSSNQTVTANTYTKLTYDTELFDTNNNFASSRFTPTIAGYYQINSCTNIAAIGDSLCTLYKNGTVYQWGAYVGGGQGLSVGVSSLVYLNGTSDYVEIYIYTGGTTIYGESVGKFTWFNGALVRAA